MGSMNWRRTALAAMAATSLYAATTAAQEEAAPAAGQAAAPATEAAEPAAAPATETPAAEPATIPVAAEPAAPLPKDDPAQEGANATRLDDVVVTATKREASSRTIAGTVNAIDGDKLEEMGARELQDFIKLVPGVTLQDGETANTRTIAIRGIGPQPGANVTTGVLIDNVSMTDPYASYLVPDLDPFDLHDLEVLKGPQGTLFGAGALNGAIRYVLNKAVLGTTEGKGFAGYTSVGQGESAWSYGGALNVPIGDEFALRVIGVKQDLPGLYDDINRNGKHEIDADRGEKEMTRIMGTWKPTERFSANAFWLTQDNFRNDLSVANNWDGQFVRTNTPGPSTSHQAFDVANLEMQYDFDWASIVSETSRSAKLLDINYDGSAVTGPAAVLGIESLRLHSKADTESFTQELRFVSPDNGSPWVWIGGIYLMKYEAEVGLNAPVANTEFLASLLGILPDTLRNMLVPTEDGLSVQYIRYRPLEAEEKSVFGEISRKFLDDRLEIGVGGRYYTEKLRANTTVDGALAIYGTILKYSGEKMMESKGFNPKGTIKYKWKDNFLVYASAARGFQFGGLNAPAPIPTDNVYELSYDPSTVWSYEIGARTDWFSKTLQVDVTTFWIDWTDMQLSQGVPSGNTDYTDNVGAARSQGVETSIRWLTPLPGLILSNAATFVRAEVSGPYTTADDFYVAPGTDLPAAPHIQTATSLAYVTFLGGARAGANVSLTHLGKAYNNILHENQIFGFNTLDGGLSLGLPAWPLAPDFAFTVTNMLDKRGIAGGRLTHIINLPVTPLASYIRPRTMMLRASFSF